MTFEDIIGNEDAVKALKGMAGSGRIPHAIMFYENDGCGAMALVLAFLDAVFAHDHKVSGLIHPDVHYVYPVAIGSKVKDVRTDELRASLFLSYWRELVSRNPYALESDVNTAFGIEGKQTSINNAEAKEILETIYLSSVEGGYKAVVIYLPEKMNVTSANRLLKAIEEPPEKTLFLLVTHAPEKVLQTISSRCQAIRVFPSSKEEIGKVLTTRFGKTDDEAAQASLVAGGSIGAALHFLSDEEDYEEQMSMFMDLMDALTSRNLGDALLAGERMAALSSREKQKAFCKFAGDGLRKIFLMQQGMPQIAGISSKEESFYSSIASKCRKSFPRMAMTYFDRAQMLIDRNVNQKIVFCDVVGHMYLSI